MEFFQLNFQLLTRIGSRYCGLRWVCKFVFRVLQTTSNE